MQIFTITPEDYQKLTAKLDEISSSVQQMAKSSPLPDHWLDIQEVCMLLKISKRTLQSYRDNHILPYSQVSGKIYFKASDIQDHLEKHYQAIQKR